MTDVALQVAPANEGQLAAWDGPEGAYWAAHADRYDKAVAAYHGPLLDAAAIGAAEHVLDIGCGTGQTTRDAARTATGGAALGVDLSSRMLEVARARAAADGQVNAAFEQADAQVHPFVPGSFDVAVSRTGAMFFADPVAAFTNVAGALRPGGRLALLTWQPLEANEWLPAFAGALAAGRELPVPPPGAPGPFALAEPDRVRSVLTAAGFAQITLDPLVAEMWFGEDGDDAARFVLGQLAWMLDGVDDETRARAEAALRSTTAAHETADGVRFGSAAWLIRAVRT
ncbi:Ubiquinone/menaquinone biosynthesis C-methylase UbiE [Pseudonocardia thermophila]|jgi:Methylase involved in ubiquinone/menaquinone biosynthesis|uniref:Ubiquinone/menaquinone biosynthesis C-methylase UbiE n=1 Tax=Pseudonocardia thermophila TaxID=1848 RepID=A0A1M6W1Q0_PSETH|nr:class I SAM-dependent methyltransferase [Pseudonocardia thermophila]SHK87597.1 Ubiquinone/menaquinone biosynthesis C-methylase UbiE [Pseudonocardia thermophila]